MKPVKANQKSKGKERTFQTQTIGIIWRLKNKISA